MILVSSVSVVSSAPTVPTQMVELWYVTMTGNDDNDCLSPATPCGTINGAIEKATSGDSIYVEMGVYTSTSGEEVILLDKDVTLRGGWDSAFVVQAGYTTVNGDNVRRGMAVISGVTAAINRFWFRDGFGFGGGIFNQGTLTISNSIVSDNNSNPYGGGILNYYPAVLVLNNTTVSGNLATSDATSLGLGGGIYNSSEAVLFLNNSTISDNLADNAINNSVGGGIYNDAPYGLPAGQVTLNHTILANNVAASDIGADCSGPITSLGYNLIGDSTGCIFTAQVSDQFDINAGLFPFTDAFGFHPLLPSSAAVDGGNPTGCADHLGQPVLTDQRDMTRPLDGDDDEIAVCDIGSYEHDPTNPLLVQSFLPVAYHAYDPCAFFDDFSDSTSGWPVGEDSLISYGYVDGEYSALAKQGGYLFIFKSPALCQLENYTVEVDAHWVTHQTSSYGIVFGLNEDFTQYYLFLANPNYPWYGLWRYNDGSLSTLIPPTVAGIYNSWPNHLKVIRNGAQITLEVNGISLASWTDNTIIGPTYVGMAITSDDYALPSDARFDNFSLAGLYGSVVTIQKNLTMRDASNPNVRYMFLPVDQSIYTDQIFLEPR